METTTFVGSEQYLGVDILHFRNSKLREIQYLQPFIQGNGRRNNNYFSREDLALWIPLCCLPGAKCHVDSEIGHVLVQGCHFYGRRAR